MSISVGLIIFMGLAGGGLLALVLMSGPRQQTSFSIMLVLSVLLGALGVIGSAGSVKNTAAVLTNAAVLFVLSFSLGYTLTTYSILSPRRKGWTPPDLEEHKEPGNITAVICLAPGEPPDYETASAVSRLEYADDASDVPPMLLRPFYMRDLKGKYRHIGKSPYREYHAELVSKVQKRLDGGYAVYAAFYSDRPGLAESLARCIEAGAGHIIVAHVRVSDPPDPVAAGELMADLKPERYGVQVTQVGPLWASELLPQIYVRRLLEAMPQFDTHPEDVGLLLVGRGHSGTGEATEARRAQEYSFQRRVKRALAKIGFSEERVSIGSLRDRPGAGEALQTLVEQGCKTIFWMPSTYSADGVNTLYDIPTELRAVAEQRAIKLVSLGAWNADDLAAEEIVAQVRAASAAPVSHVL